MTINDIWRRRAPVALAVLLTGCVVAACGSSSSSSSTSTSSASASSTAVASSGTSTSRSARRAALVACLKSHGVTLPSRPVRPPSGGAGAGTPGGGGAFFFRGGAPNPKLQAALKACGAKFSGRGRFRGAISHQNIEKYVACVRAHGYNMPNPNFSGHGSVFPANIRSNPKFQAASRACQSLLFPPRSGSTSSSTASSA